MFYDSLMCAKVSLSSRHHSFSNESLICSKLNLTLQKNQSIESAGVGLVKGAKL